MIEIPNYGDECENCGATNCICGEHNHPHHEPGLITPGEVIVPEHPTNGEIVVPPTPASPPPVPPVPNAVEGESAAKAVPQRQANRILPGQSAVNPNAARATAAPPAPPAAQMPAKPQAPARTRPGLIEPPSLTTP
jgi:hypothetical protein